MRDSAIALLAAATLLGLCACESHHEETAPPTPPSTAAPATPATAPSTPAPAPAADDKVALAVGIAKEIADDPEHAAGILGRHGMTEKQFEALLFDIAADPDLSRRYSAEMER